MSGYVTGEENQITTDGVWTYTYDAEGNITQQSKGSNAETWTFGYDNLNHLIWAQDRSTPGGLLTLTATYTYDVFGNRIEKDVWQTGGSTTTTRLAYDGQNVWADLTSSNALQTRYIRGDVVDQIFARISSSGTAAWYLTDRQGSVRNLTDASGTLQDTLTYDGFGNATESNSSFGDRYKYTGREFDSETGLQYNRARYYTAAIGRWTSQDPIGFNGSDGNLYRYVRNSPTNATDPSGMQSKITISDTGNAVGTAKDDKLGFHVSDDGARFGFKVTVEGKDEKSIKATSIKQEVASLRTFKFVENGKTEWDYFLMDKDHPKETQVDEETWNKPYKDWVKSSAVDWVTLDVDPKTGLKIDGTPDQIMKIYKGSELKGKEFSWSDFPGVGAKTLATPNLERVIMYYTFKVTATCAGKSEVAVLSIRQDIFKQGGKWVATPEPTKDPKYVRNGTWPNLPHSWPNK